MDLLSWRKPNYGIRNIKIRIKVLPLHITLVKIIDSVYLKGVEVDKRERPQMIIVL